MNGFILVAIYSSSVFTSKSIFLYKIKCNIITARINIIFILQIKFYNKDQFKNHTLTDDDAINRYKILLHILLAVKKIKKNKI